MTDQYLPTQRWQQQGRSTSSCSRVPRRRTKPMRTCVYWTCHPNPHSYIRRFSTLSLPCLPWIVQVNFHWTVDTLQCLVTLTRTIMDRFTNIRTEHGKRMPVLDSDLIYRSWHKHANWQSTLFPNPSLWDFSGQLYIRRIIYALHNAYKLYFTIPGNRLTSTVSMTRIHAGYSVLWYLINPFAYLLYMRIILRKALFWSLWVSGGHWYCSVPTSRFRVSSCAVTLFKMPRYSLLHLCFVHAVVC